MAATAAIRMLAIMGGFPPKTLRSLRGGFRENWRHRTIPF
jgi:hypothetical protein